MAVMIGNARISERNTVSGKAGDQTGREVCTQTWASGGVWSYVIRANNADVAKKLASTMLAACNNNNIGYSQTGAPLENRLSLYNQAVQHGYNLAKVGKCNCDCSSLVAVCCCAAGVPVSPSMYTGNELAVLRSTNRFTVYTAADYTKSDKLLKAGDILLRKGHTAIVVSAASTPTPAKPSKASLDTVAAEIIRGKWGNDPQRTQKLKAAGYTDAEIKTIKAKVNSLMKTPSKPAQSKPAAKPAAPSLPSYKVGATYTVVADALKVRVNAGTGYAQKSKAQLTADGQKHANANGCLLKGTKITCKASKVVAGNVWVKCPSGWVAAYYGGQYFVK